MARRQLDDVDIDTLAPFVSWDELVRAMAWKYDESLTLIGPPDRGKTTAAVALLRARRNVIVIATKPTDEPFRKMLRAEGYVTIKPGAPIPHHSIAPRVVAWPKAAGLSDVRRQRAEVERILDQVWREGNRAVLLDEVHYLAEMLGQARRVKMMLTQGRSQGLAVVSGFQRPAWVPRDVYSSAKHLVVFGTNDEADIKALGGVGGMSAVKIRRVVEHLATDAADPHDFLYVGTRTGRLLRSRFVAE